MSETPEITEETPDGDVWKLWDSAGRVGAGTYENKYEAHAAIREAIRINPGIDQNSIYMADENGKAYNRRGQLIKVTVY